MRRGSLPFAFRVIEDGEEELSRLTGLASAALVLRIDGMDGRLARNETWLTTTVTATVQSVLKNATARDLQEGSPLSFEISGGALQLGNQVIFARGSWEVLPRVGRSYLMYFTDYRGVLSPESGLHRYDVSDGILKRLARVPEGGIDRGTTTLSAAITAVRNAAASSARKRGGR